MRWKLFHEMDESVLPRNDMISEWGLEHGIQIDNCPHSSKNNKYNKIPQSLSSTDSAWP